MSATWEQVAATSLVDALAALRKAEAAVEKALALVQGQTPAADIKVGAAVRTTSVQVLAVLAQSPDPISLQDIADGVIAIRRGEDTPRLRGGTRYQEMCRNALIRLISQGVVKRVEPTSRTERMRFARVSRGAM
jgi:hypothetical protein